MVFKKKKTDIASKIATIIKRDAPNMSFDMLLQLPTDSLLYKNVQKCLLQKRGKYESSPSIVRRIIWRNKQFLKEHLDNWKNTENCIDASPQVHSPIQTSHAVSNLMQSTPTKSDDALLIMDISPISNQQVEQISPPHCAIGCSSPYKSTVHNSLEEFDVSAENFEIPKCLQNMSYASASPTSPMGNNLYEQQIVPSYRNCKFLEGSFNISQEAWDTICKDNKLVGLYYPYYIRNQIFKKVNSACQLSMKFVKYPKRSACINIFAECIHNNRKCKKFKIVVKNLKAFVYSSSIDYCHPKKLTTYLTGIERTLVKRNILHKNAFEYKKEKLIKAKRKPLLHGNLQQI